MKSNANEGERKAESHGVLTKGTLVGHYRIMDKIGAGGMGEVYLAEDTELNRKVALKFLALDLCRDTDCLARFKREAQAAAKLNHSNIITIHEVNEYNGRPFFATEYLEGLPLGEYVKDKKLSWQEIIGLAIQIAEGIGEAHRCKVIHRDIKPSNIMVDNKGKVKILDFGLAAIEGEKKLTKTGSTLGTLHYMSPEQTRGEALDEQSDIFSFGVVLYEMITSQLPFRGDHEPAIIYSIGNEEPEPLARYKTGVPDELQRIVSKALAKDKAVRYQHADELSADLKHLISTVSSAPSPVRRKRRIVMPSLVILGLLVTVLVFAPWRMVIEPADETKTATKRVVVIPFRNQTGDPSLDPLGRMIADWTTQGLLQTGLAEVIPPERLPQLEENQSARSIAKLTGASKIVIGSYYKLGDTIQFQAKIMDGNEKLLQAIEPITSETAKIMDGVEAVRQRVLGALAVVLDKRLEGIYLEAESKPSSYEAYRQYFQGVDLFSKQFNYAGALEYFKRAYAIDTSFISPLIWMYYAYANLGQRAQLDSLVRFLNLRRAQLTPVQQLYLDHFSSNASGDRMKALNALREAARIAPGAIDPYDWGLAAYRVNRPKEAIEALKTVDHPEQRWLPYWDVFAASYHCLGEHEKELEIAKLARKRFPDSFDPINYEVRALAALGKIEEVKKLIEESLTLTKPSTAGTPGGTMRTAGVELRAHGYADAATTSFDQAIEWYRNRPAEELDSLFRYGYGLTLYYARRWEEAKSIFEQFAKEAPDNIEYQGYLGFIAARQGDREKALKVSEWLKNLKQPYLRGEHTYYRACIAAILGEKDQAVTLLKDSFLQGFTPGLNLHRNFEFESLWDYPPFIEFLKPKG